MEIGVHHHPTAGLTPFFADAAAHFVGTAGAVDFLADAGTLPLADETLDYICSLHVLEHLSDPVAALHEWHRVLRPGGVLYLVVPDKRFTFDEPRAVTTAEHLLRDFHGGTTAADTAAHIDEFVFQTNWAVLNPGIPPTEQSCQQAAAKARYRRELAQGLPIDIHYHTFTPGSLDEVFRAAGLLGGDAPRFEPLARAERYPPGRDDGIGLLLRKTGNRAARFTAPPESFALTRATPSGRVVTLPLVCPISLGPLRAETTGPGATTLVAPRSDARYHFVAGIPSLLPPAGTTPVRAWRTPGWRAAGPDAVLPDTVTPSENTIRCHLDAPATGTTVDPLCFQIRGWLWLDAAQSAIAAVEAWAGDTLLGATATLYLRPDVSTALSLPADTRTGFEFFVHHPAAAFGVALEFLVRARMRDGTHTAVLANATVPTIPRDYRSNHFGILLDQRTTAVQRRANIFAEGPSLAEGSGEVAHLLRRHLGRPPCRVIDVGCGLASYGRGLLADGYTWIGAEIDADDCAELARLGLPHRLVDGRTLPFADASFDAALCLEVLEHLDDPAAVLAEIRRVAPRQLLVSVPNCELLGYLWDHLATPWHMLEADHRYFFTRHSLGALLGRFYSRVELGFHTSYPLRTVEGTPLYYHLFAIATNP